MKNLLAKLAKSVRRRIEFRLLPVFLCLSGVLSVTDGAGGGQLKSRQNVRPRPLKVLFLGNSYTYYNNLPQMLEWISTAADRPLKTEMIAEGGATLQTLWERGEAQRILRSQKWDFVILQEQSTLGNPAVNGKYRIGDPKNFHLYARKFDQEIRKAHARTVFYLTWARKEMPDSEQVALNKAYFSIAREVKGIVAPVGMVWKNIRRINPRLELYRKDNSHPNGIGSYTTACTLYAAIYDRSPVGLPSGNLPSADAKQIQQTAWEMWRKTKKQEIQK